MNIQQCRKTLLLFVIANIILFTIKIFPHNRIFESQFFLLPRSDSNSNMSTKFVTDEAINDSLWRSMDIENPANEDRIIDQLNWIKNFASNVENLNLKKKSIILFDTGVTSRETTSKIKCPGFEFNFCSVTNSMDLKSPYKNLLKFDAAIFSYIHWYSVKPIKFPLSLKQIIYTLESPFKASTNLQLNNAILASYVRGADIVIPYRKWLPFPFKKNANSSDHKNIATGKTKMAVAIVSNCLQIQNNRFGFIKELKKYLTVDVYGRCGNKKLNCTSGPTKNKCMNQIIKQYKFYLAFENANCEDYITEKVFSNALGNEVIPVVMGARQEDYENALPSHSFIHVENYKSPKDLAEYLKLLNTNDSMYNEYFKWRGTGQFRHSPSYFLCRICGMLFYDEYVQSHPPWRENQVTNEDVNICLPKNEWYWNK